MFRNRYPNAIMNKWDEPSLVWRETPKWHPRRILMGHNWRRFHPETSGFAYEDEGAWEYQTDMERAVDALREAAGLPDAALEEAYG